VSGTSYPIGPGEREFSSEKLRKILFQLVNRPIRQNGQAGLKAVADSADISGVP
jgi:hypothetical protein